MSGAKFLIPDKIDPVVFKKLILGKGWRLADVACRWGIAAATLSRLIANKDRDAKWDFLVNELPRLSRKDRKDTTRLRRVLRPNKPKAKRTDKVEVENSKTDLDAVLGEYYDSPISDENGLRYKGFIDIGSEMTMTGQYGQFADEGDLIFVAKVIEEEDEHGRAVQCFLMSNLNGDRVWWSPKDLDNYAVETGRVRLVV